MKKMFAGLFFSFFVAGLLQAEVLLDKTFDNESGKVSAGGPLKRVSFVNVEAGSETIGTDPAAHFMDDSTTESGVLEYNLGAAPAGAFFISFDLLNNVTAAEGESKRLIFSMGPWADVNSFILNGGAKRAFSLEFEQAASSKALSIRIGTTTIKKCSYDVKALQQVKIWVNDNDKEKLSYVRPDNQEEAKLNPDSVVVWVNDKLVADQSAGGIAMQASMSTGDAVLGRLGFSSTTASTVDFWIDNLHVESVSR